MQGLVFLYFAFFWFSTVIAADYVEISSGVGSINILVDPLDGFEFDSSTQFRVKASAANLRYDVWISVPKKNLNAKKDIYVAKKDSYKLPLVPKLTGNSGGNRVNTNPASLQTKGPATARPNTGRRRDGDGVKGTNSNSGTVYTLTLSGAPHLDSSYPNLPAGSYSLVFTANVQLDD